MDKMDLSLGRFGVIFSGLGACFLFAYGLPLALGGNIMGMLAVGVGVLVLFQMIRLQNSLKMARSLRVEECSEPSSIDTNLR